MVGGYINLNQRSLLVDMKKVRCSTCLAVFWVPEAEQGPSYCGLTECMPKEVESEKEAAEAARSCVGSEGPREEARAETPTYFRPDVA